MAVPEEELDFQKPKKEIDVAGGSGAAMSDKYDPETLEIDHVAEKKLVRKLDLHIIPMVMLLYLLVSPAPSALLHASSALLPDPRPTQVL